MKPAFNYLDEHLEFLFVQHLARRTQVSGVTLRFLLVVAWASSWRKASRYFPDSSSSRYSALCWLFAAGALVPIASAVLLAREKRLWRHEGLKAKCFILSIIAGMMTAIMLNFEEARRNLALPMHGLLVNGGYLLFDQVRWRSQVQLQGMQAIAFLLVATGNYLDTGDWPTFMIQVLVQLPSIVAILLALGLLMEARARRDFLQKQRAPAEQLGAVWRAALPLMGFTCEPLPQQSL
ncbi:g12409 [Coccomyxa viridis]|uniref:G12409 protein n=1 Tax=Coccomyxa viridis TaxID=1274662 RepID=A0ABP1GAL7_9CHLO